MPGNHIKSYYITLSLEPDFAMKTDVVFKTARTEITSQVLGEHSSKKHAPN